MTTVHESADLMEDLQNTDIKSNGERPPVFRCDKCELMFTKRALKFHQETCTEEDDCICPSCVICRRDQHLNKPMPKRRKLSRTASIINDSNSESQSELNPERIAFDSELRREQNVNRDCSDPIIVDISDHDYDGLAIDEGCDPLFSLAQSDLDTSSSSVQENVVQIQEENPNPEINYFQTHDLNIEDETHSPNGDVEYTSDSVESSASQSKNVIQDSVTCRRKVFCNICKCHILNNSYCLHVIQHSKSKAENSPFTCSECNEHFSKPLYLFLHIFMHYGHPILCAECRCFCSDCADAAVQIDTEGQYSKKFRCYICLCNCASEIELAEHIRTHLKEMTFTVQKCQPEPNQCQYCEKTFVSKYALQRHINRHLHPVSHKCTVCDKTFSQSGNLKRHMARHLSAKKRISTNAHNQNSSTISSITNNSVNIRTSENKSYSTVLNELNIQVVNSVVNEHSLQENVLYAIPTNNALREVSNTKLSSNIENKPRTFFPCSHCPKVLPSTSALKTHQCTHTGTLHTNQFIHQQENENMS